MSTSPLYRLAVVPSLPSEAERLVKEAIDLGLFEDEDDQSVGADILPLNARPRSRSQCEGGVRPCPWVTCRYNLYLDVRGDGVLRFNFPDREPEEMITSCALDLASDGPRTLDSVAGLMGMSKERARQIEAHAMEKFRAAFKEGY